jgi:uncharacterized protein (DUF433 family)
MPMPEPLIKISPVYLSGTPVFSGTHVPVQNLFDYLHESDLQSVLDGLPGVSRDHALAVIQLASDAVVRPASTKRAA